MSNENKITTYPLTPEDATTAFRPLDIITRTPQQWQKCPVCNGIGKVFSEYAGSVNRGQDTCPTCKGKRIISTLTGNPPADEKTEPI